MGLLFGKALESRVSEAAQLLSRCSCCEHRCGHDRRTPGGGSGPCGATAETFCFRRHISFAEETDLLPSYMVYLSGCPLQCSFCIQEPRCRASTGEIVEPRRFARIFQDQVDRGARTINLLGGEPSLHVHTILQIAAAADHPLPLVLNTNAFMTPAVLDLLYDVISLYLVDFKFGQDACALRVAGVRDYLRIPTRNLLRMDRRRLLVRHLLLPGHVRCCLEPLAAWMATHLPDVPLHLLTTYIPSANERAPEMARLVDRREIEAARDCLARTGVKLYEPGNVLQSIG